MNYDDSDYLETKIVLSPDQNLEEIVSKEVVKWIENSVKKVARGQGWMHIHKSLDEIYISFEGYNTPPLTMIRFDIEKIDPYVAENLGSYVYKFIRKKYNFPERSEYLTYHSFSGKTKR